MRKVDENTVLNFINAFHNDKPEYVFETKCSYWFALILYRRFIRDGASIMFNAEDMVFGTKINSTIYGISGKINKNHSIWKEWNSVDSFLKESITRDIIMF